jgi:hypothetical protein
VHKNLCTIRVIKQGKKIEGVFDRIYYHYDSINVKNITAYMVKNAKPSVQILPFSFDQVKLQTTITMPIKKKDFRGLK